jgi:hypothetical protein
MKILLIVILQVLALDVAVNGGTTVSDKEFIVTTELLMRKLLELDGIKAEGEARLQRKAEVMFMVLRVADLKLMIKDFILLNLHCYKNTIYVPNKIMVLKMSKLFRTF